MPLDVHAYLDRIGHRGPAPPNEATLRSLHLAHLRTVPFENLDIHLGREIVLDETRLFDKIVRRKRGGFCYELNGLFAALLGELGFRVTLLSARVDNDGQVGPEFDHLALRVDLDRPWLCDVGFGDSFLEPLVLAEGDTVEGRWRYRLVRDGVTWTMSRGEPWERSFVFTLAPRRLEDFEPMCRFHQTSPESPFTRKRVCSLATEGGRITFSNDRLVVTEGTERRERRLADEQEIRDTLHRFFDVVIHLAALTLIVATLGCGGKSGGASRDPEDSGRGAAPDVGMPPGPMDAGTTAGEVVGRPVSDADRATCPASPLRIVDWSTEDELASLVRGQWISGGATSAWPSKMVGLDFRDDRTWVLLVVDAGGVVARGQGIDETGKWVVTFAGTGSGPLALGIQFDSQPNGGTSVSRAIFTDQPVQMRLGDILGTFVRPR